MFTAKAFIKQVSNRSGHLYVVLQLRGNRNDGGPLRHGPLHELDDLLVLLLGLSLLHQVDLVLQNDDMFELHDLDGGEVLARLRLGTGLVAGDQEQGGVHDGGAVQHRRHEDVVAGTVDEADVPHQAEAAGAGGAQAGEMVVLGGAPGNVARGAGTLRIVAFVNLRVRVTLKEKRIIFKNARGDR